MFGCAFIYVILMFNVHDFRAQNYESYICIVYKATENVPHLQNFSLNVQCIQTGLMLEFVFIFSVLKLMDLQ